MITRCDQRKHRALVTVGVGVRVWVGLGKGRSHAEIYGGWGRRDKRVEVVVATFYFLKKSNLKYVALKETF